MFGSSLVLQGLREPVAAYRARDGGLGTRTNTPLHSPHPSVRATGASDWGWAWESQDPGRGNSAVCWLGLETSPRSPLPTLLGLAVVPTLQEEAARLAAGQQWCPFLAGPLPQNSGDRGFSMVGFAGSGCAGNSHCAFLWFRALAESRCLKGIISAKYTFTSCALEHR